MAAKLLHSLTDDNPDLQKQIGCMTGIFQMFDRQHMLTGGRRAVAGGPSPRRRHSPGSSYRYAGASESESSNAHLKSASPEKYTYKNMQERQRISTESSRASFSSSSHSSSFSSPECNRVTQSEQVSFDKMIFAETPSGSAMMSLQHPSPHSTRQSLDLRDFVKDSMYREIQGLSVKPKAIESKISDESCRPGLDRRERTPTDLKESLRVLAKLQEVSGYRNEPRELWRSSSCHFKDGLSLRDAPRFSYDGRDVINRAPFDSGDVSKSSIKHKELPRLSLDSRDPSMNSESNSHFLLKNTAKDSQSRPPSVVAKLMGLETLPDSVPFSDMSSGSRRTSRDIEVVNISNSFEKTEQIKPIQLSSYSKKEPSSPRWRSPDGSMKPMSRFPMEPAPWKQIEGSKGSQKSASRRAKAPTAFPSVYSEIEKRLKDLEFNQSGKDLRALKQILEAMQAKGLLETPTDEQDSNFSSHGDDEEDFASTRRKVASSQSPESPIVIMKPVKLVQKSSLDGGSALPKLQGSGGGRTEKDWITKSGERVNGLVPANKTSDKAVKMAQSLAKEGNAGSGKSSVSMSPRMQQKKLEVEKRSRPPTSPDSGRLNRQSNKQKGQLSSPGGRRRTKHRNHQKSDDQMSEVSVESRSLTPQENDASARSHMSTVQGSKNSYERSPSVSSTRSPSAKVSDFTLSYSKLAPLINEEESAESGFVPPEHSSPVSVLENILCKQDSPSPVKYVGKTLKVEASTANERNPNVVSVDSFAPVSTELGAAFEINRKKLQNIDNLVQKLRRLNSTHDEARTDYIASLCEDTDPDHRYISEILLASGLLLRDLTDFQFHPSGHPINPELFSVLEQTKTSNQKKARSTIDRSHRKLIFDITNEILAGRLAPKGPQSEPGIKLVKLARKTSNAQQLLRELCHEIDGLQAKNTKCIHDEEDNDDYWKHILSEDVMRGSEGWTEFSREVSGPVLDIERLIFKDLVNEVVIGESTGSIGSIGKPTSVVKHHHVGK